MRPTDTVLEEEVFLHLFSRATDGQSFERRIFFVCIYLAVRPRFWKKNYFLHLFSGADRVLGRRSFFCLNLFSGATDGQSFGRRSFFCIYLAVRPTDRVLEEEVFFCLNLFSGATDGHSFGRRSFFFCIYLAVRPTDRVLEEEVFFAFI